MFDQVGKVFGSCCASVVSNSWVCILARYHVYSGTWRVLSWTPSAWFVCFPSQGGKDSKCNKEIATDENLLYTKKKFKRKNLGLEMVDKKTFYLRITRIGQEKPKGNNSFAYFLGGLEFGFGNWFGKHGETRRYVSILSLGCEGFSSVIDYRHKYGPS